MDFNFFNSAEEPEQESPKGKFNKIICPCEKCNGSGQEYKGFELGYIECNTCLGEGSIEVENPNQDLVESVNLSYTFSDQEKPVKENCCPSCHGKGKRNHADDFHVSIFQSTCETCNGLGYIDNSTDLEQAKEDWIPSYKRDKEKELEPSEEKEFEDLSFFENEETELDYMDRDE